MNNLKRKLGIKAGIAVLLDVIALVVIGYVSMKTMSLLLWVLLLVLGLVFAYDAARAVTFISELFNRD